MWAGAHAALCDTSNEAFLAATYAGLEAAGAPALARLPVERSAVT
jgi:hypothetical protein